MESSKSSRVFAFGILAVLAIIWGSSFILMKRGLVVFNPIQVAALRITIACLWLSPFTIASLRQVDRKYWKYLAAQGVAGNGLPALLFCIAQTQVNSSTAGLLNSLSPLFTLILGTMLFHLKTTKWQVWGILLGFCGAILLISAAHHDTPSNGNGWYGLLIVLATVCYGLSVNITKRYLGSLTTLQVNSLCLVPVALVYVVYLLTSNVTTVLETTPGAWQALSFVAILAIIGTASSNLLFVRLIKLSNPIFASSVTYLIPIVAILWGILDGEQLTLLHGCGIAVIMAGVALVNKR